MKILVVLASLAVAVPLAGQVAPPSYVPHRVYDTKAKEMDLRGSVQISEGIRFVARMEQAHVTVEKKALTSNVPVEVEFAGGMVHANGLEITDDGARILFLNGVKARFGAEAAKGDQAP